MTPSQQSPEDDSVRTLDLSDFDLRLERYRIIQPKAEQLMSRSLVKYGQLAPVIYCQLEGSLVLVDGLQQIEVADMLGRHKSWINRRLALIERLTEDARQALRLGISTSHKKATDELNCSATSWVTPGDNISASRSDKTMRPQFVSISAPSNI